MCPPGGTSVLSIATLAYIPDATNTVDSAFSRALHHQKETLIKIPTNATKDRYRKTRKSKVKNVYAFHLIFFSNASVVGFPYLPYSKLECLPS
jgi:hypothetical protein